ncbi:Lrp/AsnC family transcriptional regulator [Paraburkholderia sp. HD33-4]|uniref:Lrp/AsnC family transcriptional regulator n=1 Tax=Paraburkholderia sp. HD33-4 TaxID=2883242 RepID=UPI001F2DACFC|nr:Lrp/AsnC family transcriptional regulator [Paraburkholderia sp. HD33-4]
MTQKQFSAHPPKLDVIDIKILRELQNEARLSSAELAERVSLTASPCWRRVKQLEDAGVISGYHAKVNAESLGYAVKASVFVKLDRLARPAPDAFEKAVRSLAEVLSCYRMSGQYDYQLLVVAKDLNAYGRYSMDYINSLPHVGEIYTSFILHEIKAEVAPPA